MEKGKEGASTYTKKIESYWTNIFLLENLSKEEGIQKINSFGLQILHEIKSLLLRNKC